MSLPPYISREAIGERLPMIFPEGTPNRGYCIRELAASTVFTMLYIGAVEGTGQFLGPAHVYRMTGQQASIAEADAREDYAANVLKKNFQAPGERWYADNTREPIRDETLREGLMEVGAVIARDDLATTSSKPRYAMKAGFAELFDPALSGEDLEVAVSKWQDQNLTKSALARVKIMQAGAAASKSGVLVTFPNKETRQLAPGPSSVISKAVIEDFAPRFLDKPAVLWLSESGNKVVTRDDEIANAIGLKIETDKNLPDLVLVDLGPAEPLIVFAEVVATDGPISTRRQEALYALTDAAGFDRSHIAFLTAYQDRESAAFKKTVPSLAWGSFAWFASEPSDLVHMRGGSSTGTKLADIIGS
ncbi:MAG: BsuBI/PstI family type II restriction endonuclease [Pseudomonadota bacterium]